VSSTTQKGVTGNRNIKKMAITLTTAYLAELKKNENAPNVILEVALDSGTVKWGQSAGGFTDVLPVVTSVGALTNRLDEKSGYSTRGSITFAIAGRDNFKQLIRDEYLKNRRVTRKDGFIAPGFTYADYAATFTGIITDWKRKGDTLTITVSDDLHRARTKIPIENATKTQTLDYRNMNPVEIMLDLLGTRLGISASLIDTAQFNSEKAAWLASWVFDRVLTTPRKADEYLNELQRETNSFIVHDGELISFKVFAPPVPGSTVEEWTDANNILENSLSQASGYSDGFFNRIVVLYDYDESGSDRDENFESWQISGDAASQDSTQWSEVKTKTIRSKWIRSLTYSYTSNITGLVVYHASRNNGAGAGAISFTYDAGGKHTLQYTAPGDSIGPAVTVSKDGKFQLLSADATRYIRVVVTHASLPASDASDTLTLTALAGDTLAGTLAQKLLARFRDPASRVTLEVDINNAAYNSTFIKPTDLKDLTTDEAAEKGEISWNRERVMITSVRPAGERVKVEAIETKFYRRYGFIAPAGQADYVAATAAERERAYIGDANNKVNGGAEDGYYIW